MYTCSGVSLKGAVIGVIPGGFTYKVGTEDTEDLDSRREDGEKRPGERTFPDR